MSTILIADDEARIRRLVSDFLKRDGHTIVEAADGKEALNILENRRPGLDMAILDVMMPGEDGFATCQRVRALADCPILFLTAKTEEADVIQGLGLGGDDYLTKPFRLGELRARVAAHLRRQHRTPQHRFRRGGLDFDLGEKAVYWGEQPVKLTRGEYAICEYLALHSGQTFSKEQIYEAVFGFDAPGDQAAVTEHIKNIRAKLRALDCHPIDTVWGVGYRWKRDLP